MSAQSNPLLDTIEYIKGYPQTLKVFKCLESKYWQAQLFLDGQTIRRSTRTLDLRQAKEAAKRLYRDSLLKQEKNQPLTSGSNFEKTALAMLDAEKARVARGDYSQSAVDDAEYILHKDMVGYFKNDHVKNIDKLRIEGYLNHISERGLSGGTRRNHIIVLRRVLNYAKDLKLIKVLPDFPQVKVSDNPRPWLNDDEFAALVQTIDKAIKDKVVVRHVPITEHLKDIVLFQRFNFLRPPDLKVLQHKQVTVVKGKKPYLRIMAQAKVKPAPVVSMEAAVPVYERLKGDPEAHILFPQFARSHAMSIAAKQFDHCLKMAGLKQDEMGSDRTLYCLRHSAIMSQLRAGVDIYLVSKNCRTVQMIERFYGSAYQAEMRIDSMHQNNPPEGAPA